MGLRSRGVSGAAVTFIGFGLPAFMMVMLLSTIYMQTLDLPVVISLFSGLQAIIMAIVANAAIFFGRSYLKLKRDFLIVALAAFLFIFGMSPFLVILLAAFIGLIIYNDQPFRPGQAVQMQAPRTIMPLILILSAAAIGFITLFMLRRNLFNLAALLFRIDLFAFGGGFASLPLMLNEVVEVRAWMDYQTFMNGIALGQITPEPIVITATFVGYILYGHVGRHSCYIRRFFAVFLDGYRYCSLLRPNE
jgi:chromate transporter